MIIISHQSRPFLLLMSKDTVKLSLKHRQKAVSGRLSLYLSLYSPCPAKAFNLNSIFYFSIPLAEILVGYQQKWLCSEYENQNLRSRSAHAFVDGGMWFNQTDKSLYVPECGYYQVSSQILFSVPPPLTKSKTVFHLLKFERNCSSWQPSTAISVIGHSSLGPYDDIFQSGVTTTFTSDVVKLCRGGRVWVEIPDGPNGAPCCPRGDEHGTFISAVLIRHTTCHWPPRMTMDNLNHDDGV